MITIAERKITLLHHSQFSKEIESDGIPYKGKWMENNIELYEGKEDQLTDLELIPEFAGRLCYMSFDNPRPGGNEVYLDHILDVGHHSVLEHSCIGFLFEGISRSLTHELVRHRAGMSYSQLSQRYCDNIAFVEPPAIKKQIEIIRWYWRESCKRALDEYNMLCNILSEKLSHKQAREAARAVLPNCTETKIVATGNIRSWRHFLELRGSIHADKEIRMLAINVYEELLKVAKNCFQDVVMEKIDDEYVLNFNK